MSKTSQSKSNLLKSIPISLQFYDYEGHALATETAYDVYQLAKSELDYYQKAQSSLAEHYKSIGKTAPSVVFISIVGTWSTMVREIDQFIADSDATDTSTWTEEQFKQRFDQFLQNGSRYKEFCNNRQHDKWVYSKRPYTKTAVDVSLQYGAHGASAFLSFVARGKVTLGAEADSFQGTLCAYEFLSASRAPISKRATSERAAMTRLLTSVTDEKKALESEFDTFKSELSDWQKARDQQLADADMERQRYWKDIESKFQQQEQDHKSQMEERTREYQERISTLEETYEKKLQLSAPSNYWKTLATSYAQQGYIFGVLALVIGIALVWILTVYGVDAFTDNRGRMLDMTTELMIKSVLLFGSITAISLYLMRVLMRMALTSFHSSRDATQRRSLTYLYLALRKGDNIDNEAISLVLQSLFSRTETGLIQNEGGATMPSSNDIIKLLNQSN